MELTKELVFKAIDKVIEKNVTVASCHSEYITIGDGLGKINMTIRLSETNDTLFEVCVGYAKVAIDQNEFVDIYEKMVVLKEKQDREANERFTERRINDLVEFVNN